MSAPAFEPQSAVLALPAGARIPPILLAHHPLDRALHSRGQAQLEQIGLAALLGFTHHRLVAEADRRGSAMAAVRLPSHPTTPIGGARNAWRYAGCRAQPPPPAPVADWPSCSSDSYATGAPAYADCSSQRHLPGARRAASPWCRYRVSTARSEAVAWRNRDAPAARPGRHPL